MGLKCLWGHDWDVICDGEATNHHVSILFNQQWKEKVFVEFKICKNCRKTKAVCTEPDGTVETMSNARAFAYLLDIGQKFDKFVKEYK